MEFLMTYGWAILVVLVVIGALAYFGVLSPSTLLPEKCTFPVGLMCNDFYVGLEPGGQNTVQLMLQNGAGRDILIRGATARGDALEGACTTLFVGGAGGDGMPTSLDECKEAYSEPIFEANGCTGGSRFRNGESKTVIMSNYAFGVGFTCTFKDTGRDKNRYNVTIFYTWLDSPGITHIFQGELLARKS